MEFATPAFWLALLQIIAVDIVLSGDNAVVIALACRNLPPAQQRKGILWGVGGAITLRVVLTAFAAGLMGLPWVKLLGGVLLLWIGVKLLVPQSPESRQVVAADHLWQAVKTIIVADCVMSLDNVVGVAAAAHGSVLLLVLGLLISIPLIVGSSHLFLKLMMRFPFIVTLAAALLGYIAGEMMIADPALRPWLAVQASWVGPAAGAVGACLVVAVGRIWARLHGAEEARTLL